jgi:photosystem II stability/assembly factor-like uncharacterized protein
LRIIVGGILYGFALAAWCGPEMAWHWSNPQPSGDNLIKVAFVDSSRGLVLADNGTVSGTLDGGKSWSERGGRIDNDYLVSAVVLDSTTYVSVSGFGKIWRTVDGGRTWAAAAEYSSLLTQIGACGDGALLAVGKDGIIVRSADRGTTWTQVLQDSANTFLLGVHCAGRVVFAVGDGGALFRSRDQGLHWDSLPRPTQEVLTSVAFADSMHGFVTTDRGKLAETRDGGNTWKISVLDSLGYLGGLIRQGKHWMLTSTEGGIWISLDDGVTWIRSVSGTSTYITSTAFIGSSGGIGVGSNGLILQVDGFGNPWQMVRRGETDFIDGLATLSPLSWVAFGAPGMIMKTVDGGANWKERPLKPDTVRYLAGAFQGQQGLLAGDDGIIVRTADGGETWAEATTPRKGLRLFGVAWGGKDSAVAVGEAGAVWRSTDGGRTWGEASKPSVVDTLTLSAVAFGPDGNGYIVGYRGVILRSSDRGASWTSVPSQSAENLFGIAFRDASTGIAVGGNGLALTTADGGLSWARQTLGFEDDYVFSVSWLGGDTALAVGDWGHGWFLSLSTDAGLTWADQRLPTRKNLWALATLGPGRVALTGQDGAILLGSLQSGFPGGIIVKPPRVVGSFTIRRASFTGQVQFRTVLAETQRVTLTAYSPSGRSLGTLFRGTLNAGEHVLLLPFVSRGPALIRMEASGAQSKFSRTGLLPY